VLQKNHLREPCFWRTSRSHFFLYCAWHLHCKRFIFPLVFTTHIPCRRKVTSQPHIWKSTPLVTLKSQKYKSTQFLLSMIKSLSKSSKSFIRNKVHFQVLGWREVIFEYYKSTFFPTEHLLLMNFVTYRIILSDRKVSVSLKSLEFVTTNGRKSVSK
jgi:hypothetical protein